MVHLVVNLDRRTALPAAYRAAVERACDAVSMRMLAKYDSINPPSLRRLVSAGAAERLQHGLRELPEHRASLEHFGEVAAKDPQFKRGMDSITAFLREHLQWLQVSEHAFDGFQIAINGRV